MVVGVPAAHADDLDTTPPTATIIAPVENQQVPLGAEPAPTVQFECTDDIEVATCDAVVGRVDAQAPPLTAGNGMPLDVTWPGQYYLRVTSTDTAGNPAESVVHFEIVGDPPQDNTAPSIQIAAPVDAAQVKKGASLIASYLCEDSESGIESCDGTVESGQAVDTSTLGFKEFTVVARDKSGNESTETVEYEVIAPASVTVSGTIKDTSGQLVPGATVQALLAGTSDVVASTEANSEGVYSLTLSEGTYDLRYRGPEGSRIGANLKNRDLSQDAGINVTLGQVGVTLSGTLSDGVGGLLQYAYLTVFDAQGTQVASQNVDASGAINFELLPGSYRFNYYGSSTRLGTFNVYTTLADYQTDTTLDLNPNAVPVTVHLLGADGRPASGSATLICYLSSPNTTNTNSQASGSGDITVYGPVTPEGQTCGLTVDPDEGPNINQRITIGPDGTELTILTFGAGVVLDGDTEATNDGDNVADAVEALAPNNGDGNNDGTPDYEQQNVTSLPVNGGALGGGANYVTVAAPAGTELTNVYTIDPTDTTKVETPPPPGVTLPEGLTNLVLKGVEAGTDQTVSIYTASTQNVTGYAKYDPNTKQWSLLPDDRVAIFADRVEITLTDGGTGDDDGQVNGRISDPGGIAIVENLDTVAPTVTGATTSQPNANGWYNDDVTVEWTATDPEPSSGLAGQPEHTIVTGEGASLTAESAQVCDTAGNCGTGKVEGIKIDRTKPEIVVTGVADGGTYTLGAVPVAQCSASDALSGVEGVCSGTLTGGNSNGVGEFTYETTAIDKAGNERRKAVTYRVVYRFDGFLPPINDPALVPGAARSVFKSGSTVPVKLQVKRADGTQVDPLTPPEWLTPEKGSATAATVNEEVWTDPATTGTQFAKTGDQWHYNWKTKGIAAGFSYRIGVKLDDGTKHYVVVAAK